MRRVALVCIAVGLLSTSAVAVAQYATPKPTPTPLTIKANGTATKGKGTKKKPVAVGVSYTIDATTSDGSRVESFKTVNNAWGGVVDNGQLFPTCTLEKISNAQSDASCPKKSLIGVGKLVATIGPDNDFNTPGAPCLKDVRVYNAGKHKVSTLLVGPGSDCAGVGYLPPFEGKWQKKGGVGGGLSLNTPIPSFISHPLPGVLGSVQHQDITFKKATTRVRGKKRGYLESVKCKGKRQFSQLEIGDPSGTNYPTKKTLGSC